MKLTSKQLHDLALKHIPLGAFVFSTECFDADFNIVEGECQDAALDFIRAVIAANNKKVLADLKPFARLHDDGFYTFNGGTTFAQNLAGFRQDVYSAETVSALIQERDALAAKVKELEAQAEMDSAQINSLIKKLPPLPDLRPRKARFA